MAHVDLMGRFKIYFGWHIETIRELLFWSISGDLVDKDTNASKAYEAKIREEIAPFTDVPIVFISSISKQRIFKAVETGC